MTATARTERRYFYVAMAAIMFLTTIVGFSGSDIAPASSGRPVGPSVVHLHALVGFAWIVLFLVQTSLVAAGRAPNHQAMGMVGIAVATAMVFSGLMIATKTMSVGIAAGAEDAARTFAIFPITIILLFAGFFTAAVAKTTDLPRNARRPRRHDLRTQARARTACGRHLPELIDDPFSLNQTPDAK